MQQDYLVVESRDGQPYIVTAPLPEHVNIDRELFEQAEVMDPAVDFPTGLEPPALWCEQVKNKWVIHFDAVNVHCAYRIDTAEGDGPLSATLLGWAEK